MECVCVCVISLTIWIGSIPVLILYHLAFWAQAPFPGEGWSARLPFPEQRVLKKLSFSMSCYIKLSLAQQFHHFKPHGTSGFDDNWPATWLSPHFGSSLNSGRGQSAVSSETPHTTAETSSHSATWQRVSEACTSRLIDSFYHQDSDPSKSSSWTHNELPLPCWTLIINAVWTDFFVYFIWMSTEFCLLL